MLFRFIFFLCLIAAYSEAAAQSSVSKAPSKNPKPGVTKPAAKPAPVYPSVHILGLRPGITFDSASQVMKNIAVDWREVTIDTMTRNFSDKSVKMMVADSIYVRFAYMRMAFVFESSTNRLRRISLTPRLSSVAMDRDDDLNEILLLYFGQMWGKPEIQLDLTPAQYRWIRGNIEIKGYIRRGYPLWVIEG
jgi:hypothetical protein